MPPTTDREPDANAAAPEPAPPRWALGPSHLLLVAVWAVVYLVLSYLPLRGEELWGHVLYGEWILEHRSLPAEDPVMPLSAGIKVIAENVKYTDFSDRVVLNWKDHEVEFRSKRSAYEAEEAAFISAAESGEPTRVDFGEGLKSLELSLGAIESSRAERRVDLPL